jgi:hypothetical protein
MAKSALFKIVYSAKYRALGVRYHLRHCIVIQSARRGRNCLVKLHGGELAIVPRGNLVLVDPGDAGCDKPNKKGSGWAETTERNRDWVRESVHYAQIRADWGF